MLLGPRGNFLLSFCLYEQELEVAVVHNKGKMLLVFNRPVHQSSMEAFHCPNHWGYDTQRTPVGQGLWTIVLSSHPCPQNIIEEPQLQIKESVLRGQVV